MNNLPLPIPVVDECHPLEPGNDKTSGNHDAVAPPSPELLRSFVYREPTGLAEEDDDSHPHRRRSDRIPQK